MHHTTDFVEWLTDNWPENHEDIYDLYSAISQGTSFGVYKAKRFVYMTHVYGPSSILVLNTDNIRETFLKILDQMKTVPDFSMEAWHQYVRDMEKGD